MRRSIILPSILIVYLLVMAYIGWPYYQDNIVEYIAIIVVTLLVIGGLYYILRRREKMRNERRKKMDASYRRNFRNDDIR